MPFEIGETSDVSKSTGNPLSLNTIKIYKSKLNAIAKGGFTTPESIIANPKKVVQYINTTIFANRDATKYSETDSPHFRLMYCAIFWALSATTYCSKPNPLFTAFKKHKLSK